MNFLSEQRLYTDAAARLSRQAAESLQPLHDDLSELSPGFDGLVYFAIDQQHTNNANAVAAVQPASRDTERFAFYATKINKHRVDLASTALGTALALSTAQFLPSRMNPQHHVTWAERTLVDSVITGGVQASFNTTYGPLPSKEATMRAAYHKHHAATRAVAADFYALSKKVTSLGDSLELLPPETPNVLMISWDLVNSTPIVRTNYGAVRNYFTDMKQKTVALFAEHVADIQNIGDGQNISLRLPESVDAASSEAIRLFAAQTAAPLLEELKSHAAHLATVYGDIAPRLHLSVGLGYLEQDSTGANISDEYWALTEANKKYPAGTVGLTPRAREVLGGVFTN